MTPEELKIIEDRCSKATPGPWSAILPDITTSNWYISRRPGEGEDVKFLVSSLEKKMLILSLIPEKIFRNFSNTLRN